MKALVNLSLVLFSFQIWGDSISWKNLQAGTFNLLDVGNWTGSVLPGTGDTADFAAPSGNQILQGGATAEDVPTYGELIFLNRDKVNTATRTRTVEGFLQVDGTNWFKTGITRIVGTLSGGAGAMTRVATSSDAQHDATLTVTGNLLVPERGALWVGAHSNGLAENPSSGRVILEDGGEIDFSSSSNDTNSGLSLGRQGTKASGSFVQRGGRARFGRLLVSYAANAQGCYDLFDGVLDVPYVSTDTRFRIGHAGTGQFRQHGGTVYIATNNTNVADTQAPEIGSSRTSSRGGLWFADGGLLSCPGAPLFIHGYADAAAQGPAEMTLKDSAQANVKNVIFRGKQGAGRGQPGVLNLLDGAELVTGSVRSRMTNSVDSSKWDAVNIRNATIRTSGMVSGDYDFFCLTDAITLYGGTFEFCCRKNVTMKSNDWTANLRTAKGYGVASLTVTAGGSKYWVPPMVTISGGSGSNATAVACLDYDTGSVTGLVVTCSGEGYAADDVLTVAIANPSGTRGSGAAATASLAPIPQDGTLVKTGTARLVFYDQTAFDGVLENREGEVILSTARTNSLQSVRKIVVGGPSMPKLQSCSGGTGGQGVNTLEAQEKGLNPAAELQIGSAYGPGQVLGGGGVEGTVFTQHFARLSVQGPGGTLQYPLYASHGIDATHGLCYVFDDYVCAPGATLTVGEGEGFSIKFPNATPGAILPGLHVGNSKLPATVDENHVLRSLTAEELAVISESGTLDGECSTLTVSNSSAVTLEISDALTLRDGQLTVGGVAAGNGVVTVSGGTLTSGTGVLDVYDHQVLANRRNNDASKEFYGTLLSARLVDDAERPVALSVTGRPWPDGGQGLAKGPCIKLENTENTYSGGTYIHDTALAVPTDAVLGPVPATVTTNIFTSGMAMIRAPFDAKDKATLDLAATRGILVQGGFLGLYGGKDNQSDRVMMRVNGPISGCGTIGIGHWSGAATASLVELAGDNSGFSGTVAIMGRLRIAGERALPPCGILLAEREPKSVEGGLLCMSGAFTRACGTDLKNEVSWRCANRAYAGLVGTEAGIGGGFAAWGGPLTVNLGGNGAPLAYPTEAFTPSPLRLQDDFATDDLIWMNPVEIASETALTNYVARNSSTARVLWRGALTGGGAFVKRGAGVFALADGGDVAEGVTLDFNSYGFQAVVTNALTIAGSVVNPGGFRKLGAGVATASGTWTTTGAIAVEEGTLRLDGTVTGQGGVTVAAAGTLGGAGTLTLTGKSLTVDGALEASVAGTLAVTGDVACGADSKVVVADERVFDDRTTVLTALTCTGTMTGAPSGAGLPSGWTVRAGNGSVRIRYTDGTMLIVR